MSYQEQKGNVLRLQSIKTEDNANALGLISTHSLFACRNIVSSSISAFVC